MEVGVTPGHLSVAYALLRGKDVNSRTALGRALGELAVHQDQVPFVRLHERPRIASGPRA